MAQILHQRKKRGKSKRRRNVKVSSIGLQRVIEVWDNTALHACRYDQTGLGNY